MLLFQFFMHVAIFLEKIMSHDLYMKKLSIDNIQWRTTDPISTMNIGYDDDDKRIPVPKELLEQKLKIKKNDRVVLVYNRSVPIITAPIIGSTVKDLFKSINKGMHKIIQHDNVENIYSLISRYVPKKRFELITLFEQHKLTPYHLVRNNYDFYEGNLRRNNSGIWTYAVGS